VTLKFSARAMVVVVVGATLVVDLGTVVVVGDDPHAARAKALVIIAGIMRNLRVIVHLPRADCQSRFTYKLAMHIRAIAARPRWLASGGLTLGPGMRAQDLANRRACPARGIGSHRIFRESKVRLGVGLERPYFQGFLTACEPRRSESVRSYGFVIR
jgi:hypothetical protein